MAAILATQVSKQTLHASKEVVLDRLAVEFCGADRARALLRRRRASWERSHE